MRKKLDRFARKRVVFTIFLVSLVIISLIGIILIKQYQGYLVGVLNATAGYVYEVNIDASYDTFLWGAIYGNAFANRFINVTLRNFTINASEVKNYDFDLTCLGVDSPDFYISHNHPDNIVESLVRNITPWEFDEIYFNNRTDLYDSAYHTFTENVEIYWGDDPMTGMGLKTFSWDGHPGGDTYPAYEMLPLRQVRNDCDNFTNQSTNVSILVNCSEVTDFVFFGVKLNYSTLGFDGSYSNYQAMLPIPWLNNSEFYYVFNDPNEYCSAFRNTIYGCVTDNRTGEPLGNVSIIAGGERTYTHNETGCYSLTVGLGDHVFIGTLEDYFPHIAQIEVTQGDPIEHNFSMMPLNDVPGPTVYVDGRVTDINGNPIDNVDIYIGPGKGTTNDNGNYNLETEVGRYYVIGLHQDYAPHVDLLWLNSTTVTWIDGKRHYTYDFVMDYDPTPQSFIYNPPIETERPSPQNVFKSMTEINRKIKQNRFLDENVTIYNFNNAPIKIFYEVEGEEIQDILTIQDVSSFIMGKRGTDMNILILGSKEIGVYEGNVSITGDINMKIPVKIEIVEDDEEGSKGLVLEIDATKENYALGGKLDFRVDVKNLKVGQINDVELKYFLKNLDTNEIIYLDNENKEISVSLSLLKKYIIDKNLELGEYILGVEALYDNDRVETAIDYIKIRPPFWNYKFLGIRAWIWILFILSLVGTILGYILIKIHIEKKKRFHVKLDESKIPQKGERTVKVGHIAETKKNAYIDIDKLTTHTIIAGSTGGGKSISAQDIVEECLNKNVAVLVFDPTAQWSGMLRKLKEPSLLKLYSEFGMKESDAQGFKGNIKDVRN
ncbi:MAG: helicase HerA domain-containing protein, partial [Nanoarchaeota archaeon]